MAGMRLPTPWPPSMAISSCTGVLPGMLVCFTEFSLQGQAQDLRAALTTPLTGLHTAYAVAQPLHKLLRAAEGIARQLSEQKYNDH